MCQHSEEEPCPPANARDWWAARTIASHDEQGWSLLCNGVVLFSDGGALFAVPPADPPQLAVAPAGDLAVASAR